MISAGKIISHKMKGTRGIEHIFSHAYLELFRLSEEYVTYLISEIIRKSDILPILKHNFTTSDKIVSDLSYIKEAVLPVHWMLSYLSSRGLLEEKRVNNVGHFKSHGDFPKTDPDIITGRMLDIDRGVLPSNLLLEKAARGYPDFLRGRRNAIDILFTDDKMKLWTEYFSNANSGYAVYNSLATYGLLKWLPNREGLRILEAGGGTGSAAVDFLGEMCSRGLIGKIEEYIFSDISPIFLRVGNRALMEELPGVEMVQLKTMDFNLPFTEQGIAPDSIDIVYGVNSVHAAKDLVRTLEYVKNVLRPGGLILLSECARPGEGRLLFQELIFNLFETYRDVNLSEIRPMPGFLDVNSWMRVFKKAGFKKIELLTNDYDKTGSQSWNGGQIIAAVIKGEK